MDNQQLEQDLQSLETEKQQLQQDIDAILSQNPERKVLDALSKQRYFYFKAKPDVIFDRDTGYLWPEKQLDISRIKGVELTGKNLGNKDQVKLFLEELKTLDYLAFKGWEIPAPYDFRVIVEDGKNRLPNFDYINDKIHRVYRNNIITNRKSKLLVIRGWVFELDYCIRNESAIPHEIIMKNQISDNWKIENVTADKLSNNQFFLVNKNLAILLPELDPSFDKFPKQERKKIWDDRWQQVLENCLQIFQQNKLIPIFDEHRIAPLYELLLNKLPQLQKQLDKVENKFKQLTAIKSQQGELLSSSFNYRELLKFSQFDCQDIDSSVIRFAHATIEWCELLEEKIAEYQIRQHKLVTEANALTAELAQTYKINKTLLEFENNLLAQRKAFMKERLSLNMHIPMANLASMKLQSHQLKKQLFELNYHENGLYELGQLAAQPRPSFDLVAENSATMLTDMLLKMEFYDANRELVKNLISIEKDWNKDYKAFKITSKENLNKACTEDDIDAEHAQTWLIEWGEKRWLIEQRLQPLIEKGLEAAFTQHRLENQTPVALQLIALLKRYKDKLDLFYLHDKKSIHQKFAFQANGGLQEKFEAESELYKHTLNFQQALHEIVFGLEKVEERLWLLNWSDSLIDMTIDVILDVIRDKALDGISKTVINDFSQLKLQNYATFIDDAKVAAEMMNQWDKDYNALMFKMRKELNTMDLNANQNTPPQKKPETIEENVSSDAYKINFNRDTKGRK